MEAPRRSCGGPKFEEAPSSTANNNIISHNRLDFPLKLPSCKIPDCLAAGRQLLAPAVGSMFDMFDISLFGRFIQLIGRLNIADTAVTLVDIMSVK